MVLSLLNYWAIFDKLPTQKQEKSETVAKEGRTPTNN